MPTISSVLTKAKTKITVFAALFAIATIIPNFIHQQWITGPLINAILIITTIAVGPVEGLIVGLFPSTVALSSGLLPLALAPMVPFIIISNAILVTGMHYMKPKLTVKNFTPKLIIASFIKFIFLYESVQIVMKRLIENDQLVAKLTVMMSWPQLYTALIGGVIAFGILKGAKKVKK